MSSESSPSACDDLFADINWPDSEADEPSDEGLYSSGSLTSGSPDCADESHEV